MPKESPSTARTGRRPLKLRHVGLIAVLVLASPFVGFCTWDRIEASRVMARLEAVEPEAISIRDTLPTTDEQKRASRLYSEALQLLPEESPAELRRLGNTITGLAKLPRAVAARDPRLAELSAFESRYTAVLQRIDEAAALDAHGYLSSDRPRFSAEEWRAGRPNVVRIARLALQGESEPAARALVATLRLRRMYPPSWRHMAPPTAHSLQLVLSSGPVSLAMLAELQREYEALAVDLDVERRLRTDRAQFLAMFPADVLGTAAAGATGYRRPPPFEALAYKVTRPWRRHAMAAVLDDYADALVIARTPWPGKIDATEAFVKGRDGNANLGSRRPSVIQQVRAPWGPNVGTRVLSNAVSATAEGLARAGSAIAAIAIARYAADHGGEFPPSLDALMPAYLVAVPRDPFTGAAVLYAPRASSYVVYSVGSNRRDDGGAKELSSDLLPRAGNAPDIGLTVTYLR